MPLELFLTSLVAIVLLALLAGKLNPVKSLLSEERVLRHFVFTYPDDKVIKTYLGSDGLSAIIELENPEMVGVVTLPADRVVARIYNRTQLKASVACGKNLILNLNDITQPNVQFSQSPNTLDLVTKILNINLNKDNDSA